MNPRIFFIIFGIALAILLLLSLDSLTGSLLFKTGYFKAMPPNLTDVFKTNEFDFSASISAQGIRNEEVILPKPKNTYRILALGDSFTYGWGVKLSESWPKQLEKKLNIAGGKIEVINAGVPGAGLDEEVNVCKAYTELFDVDMILLGFFSTDDLYQAATEQYYSSKWSIFFKKLFPNLTLIANPVVGKWHKDIKDGGKTFDISKIWQNHALGLIKQNPKILSKIDPAVLKYILSGKLNAATLDLAIADPLYLIKFLSPEDFKFELEATDKILTRIKKECIGKRPSFIILIPSEELVSADFFKYKEQLGFKLDPKLTEIDLDQPLRQLAQKSGFKYLSLLSNFRKDKCLDCYYSLDFHLNPMGHERIADYLSKMIKWR